MPEKVTFRQARADGFFCETRSFGMTRRSLLISKEHPKVPRAVKPNAADKARMCSVESGKGTESGGDEDFCESEID